MAPLLPSFAVLPLELTGIAVGVLFVAIAVLLGFRHKYVDGFGYPWQITMSFFATGALLILIVTEIRVVGVLPSRSVTLSGYLGFGALGLCGLCYLWFWYPKTHPCASERA